MLFERTPYEELNFHFNSFSRYIKNKIIKLLIKFLYKKADLVVSNNKTTSAKLRSELKIKISQDYRWITLWDIIYLSKKTNYINCHLRTLISHLN